MNHYKNNLLEELHRLTEAVQASHADIAPTSIWNTPNWHSPSPRTAARRAVRIS